MFNLLLLLLLVVPLVELFLLIEVGARIGAFSTVLLCILTAVLGAALLRIQGLLTLQRVRWKFARGELPAVDLLQGLILLLCGFLLLTPGLTTDLLGFAGLVPTLRVWLATQALQRLWRASSSSGPVIIEGEFRQEDERRTLGSTPTSPRDRT